MLSQLRTVLAMTLATLVLTGLVYPLAVAGLAQLLFPERANGSPVAGVDGRVVGSELIGQGFKQPGYFHSRPSNAGTGWDATASSGSNLGPTSRGLRDRVAAEAARLRAENPDAAGPVPGELVTTSASGLDPHLSPEAALWQAPRVASARGVPLREVQALVQRRVEGRSFGLLGEPRVNVLLLNLDLNGRFGAPGATPP